jgi:hypothetical protein
MPLQIYDCFSNALKNNKSNRFFENRWAFRIQKRRTTFENPLHAEKITMKKRVPKRFSPPISERETDELIGMANNIPDGYWHEDAVQQARQELEQRKVSAEYEYRLLDRWRQSAEKWKQKEQGKLFKNQFESYPLGDKILIFLTAPVILFRPVARNGESLAELKGGNYTRKYKQRLICLALGTLFWLIVMGWASSN